MNVEKMNADQERISTIFFITILVFIFGASTRGWACGAVAGVIGGYLAVPRKMAYQLLAAATVLGMVTAWIAGAKYFGAWTGLVSFASFGVIYPIVKDYREIPATPKDDPSFILLSDPRRRPIARKISNSFKIHS